MLKIVNSPGTFLSDIEPVCHDVYHGSDHTHTQGIQACTHQKNQNGCPDSTNIHTRNTTHPDTSYIHISIPNNTAAPRVGGVDIRSISSSTDAETISVRTPMSVVPGRAIRSVQVMETVRSSTVFMVSGGCSIVMMNVQSDSAAQSPCICVCVYVCVRAYR